MLSTDIIATIIPKTDFEREVTKETLKTLFSYYHYTDVSPLSSDDMEVEVGNVRAYDTVSLASSGEIAHPNTPIAFEFFDNFTIDFVTLLKNINKNAEKQELIGQYAFVFCQAFAKLDSDSQLTSADKMLIIGNFATKNEIILPGDAKINLSPYLFEMFRYYRLNFYNTPATLALAVRGIISSAGKLGLVVKPSLPDITMPLTIRFASTLIYKKILAYINILENKK